MEAPTTIDVDAVLLDIEGTVCPISFVKDVLFPYFLRTLNTQLPTLWSNPEFQPYLVAVPSPHNVTPEAFLSHITDLVNRDIKIAYLKNLQGYIWTAGYASGELTCPLFNDVYPAFRRWKGNGVAIVIYSSGSVAAQKLLFGHTAGEGEDGKGEDLRGYIGGWFDTVNAGLKGDRGSYVKIAGSEIEGLGRVEVGKWLFLSDRVEEVEAAKSAGMNSWVVVREGNAVLTREEKEGNVLIGGFEEARAKKA